MQLHVSRVRLAMLLALVLATTAATFAADAPAGKSQKQLDAAADAQKYAFILFYKEQDADTLAMAKLLKAGAAKHKDKAVTVFVQITNEAEKATVDEFDVSKAAMPTAMAVAPNGAITGVYTQVVTEEDIDEAFVTPTMMNAMRSMQDGKIVLVCVQPTAKSASPKVVKDFLADPQFKDRIAVVKFLAQDPAESKLMTQMNFDAAEIKATKLVVLAAPGVLIGKFENDATLDDVATKLHKAGKCCDNPKCKYNKPEKPAAEESLNLDAPAAPAKAKKK